MNHMKRLATCAALFAGLVLVVTVQAQVKTNFTKTVTVNTSAADFTVVAAGTNQTVRITHIDAQNIGTAAKVSFQICDGPCGAATSKIGPFELSPATATSMGGGYTFICSGDNCRWNITPGNAVISQVDTGATNNVRLHVTYESYQR